MIDPLQAFWLALVQGLTEFLPISSSGHLILAPMVMGWPDQGLAFDVAVHVGSLIAVLAYFRRDLAAMAASVPDALQLRDNRNTRLIAHLAVATVPVVIAGFLFEQWVEDNLRSPLVIAWTMLGFALVLWFADRVGSRERTLDGIDWRIALVIGLAQVIALVPGTSRAGITITAALLLGMTRVDASRFSFLLSIPTIIAAGVLEGASLANGVGPVDWTVFIVGVTVSALSAYACIALFLHVIERIGFMPFVIYRIILGAVLLYLFW